LLSPEDVETEVEEPGPMLSMRSKVFIGGTCFLLILGIIAYLETPHYVGAVRGLVEEDETIGSEGPVGDVVENGYVTLFREDFDEKSDCWILWDDKFGIFYISNGSMFLNLTESINPSDTNFVDFLLGIDIPYHNNDDIFIWLYTNLEIRLRYGDPDILGETGDAWRFWGFVEKPSLSSSITENILNFETWPPESGAGLDGLYTSAEENSTISLFARVNDSFNLSEWHTYRILWEPGNCTFTVDGKNVANTSRAPNIPLELMVSIQSRCPKTPQESHGAQGWVYYLLPGDVSIEVDYVRLFVRRGTFNKMHGEICALISDAQELIGSIGNHGGDTNELESSLDYAMSFWKKGNYVYFKARELLTSLISEISVMRP